MAAIIASELDILPFNIIKTVRVTDIRRGPKRSQFRSSLTFYSWLNGNKTYLILVTNENKSLFIVVIIGSSNSEISVLILILLLIIQKLICYLLFNFSKKLSKWFKAFWYSFGPLSFSYLPINFSILTHESISKLSIFAIGKETFIDAWWILKGHFKRWFIYADTFESIFGYKKPTTNSMWNFSNYFIIISYISFSDFN